MDASSGASSSASSPPSSQGQENRGQENRELIQLEFDDNSLVPLLCGEHDQHLLRIERDLGVSIMPRGNLLAISGVAEAVEAARTSLNTLYDRLSRGFSLDAHEVEAALRGAPGDGAWGGGGKEDDLVIRTRKRHIAPRSKQQAVYLRALRTHELVFALGPAGTGKTYLAVATALAMLLKGEIDHIILSRPAVEAGERLGFLPGDLREKVDPYLRPLFDALHDMIPSDQVMKRMAAGDIEVAPLAFMRGRTLSNAFVILDEAQNTTPVQMKMFLTRLGENARMAVTGDPSQVDLPRGTRSGLHDAIETLKGVKGMAVVPFTDADVVRNPLVTQIVRAYDRCESRSTARSTAQSTAPSTAQSTAKSESKTGKAKPADVKPKRK